MKSFCHCEHRYEEHDIWLRCRRCYCPRYEDGMRQLTEEEIKDREILSKQLMEQETQMRRCPACNQDRDELEFQYTGTKCCVSCYELY